jgi:hypothetical protein
LPVPVATAHAEVPFGVGRKSMGPRLRCARSVRVLTASEALSAHTWRLDPAGRTPGVSFVA